jgi:hypothetical protein
MIFNHYLKSIDIISSIFSINVILILELLLSTLLNLEINMDLNPNLAASLILVFIFDTALSSPDKPTSAAKQIFLSIEISK